MTATTTTTPDPASAAPAPSSPPGRVLLLANPHSRRGALLAGDVAAALEIRGVRVLPESFSSPEEAAADIARRAGEIDAVVVCGGDGTVNGALPGVLASGLPLGIAPCGTANDLARTLGLPADPIEAVGAVARGLRKRIDVGVVNDRPFLNVASIGLSVDLAKSLCKRRKKVWGRLAYAIAALQVATRARPFSAEIRTRSGVERVKSFQIAVGNGRHYGGGMVVEETATIDDGTLDLYSLETANVWRLALMMRCFAKGAHGAWRDVRAERCTEFEVVTSRPMDVNADGEIIASTPARFSILPQALEVFAP